MTRNKNQCERRKNSSDVLSEEFYHEKITGLYQQIEQIKILLKKPLVKSLRILIYVVCNHITVNKNL